MDYRPTYGHESAGKSQMKGQFAVTVHHEGTGKSVSGLTTKLRRDAFSADFEGHLDVGESVMVELALRDGKTPIRVPGRITDRYRIPTTHQFSMTVELAMPEGEEASRINAAVEAVTSDLIRFFREFPLFSAFTVDDVLLLSQHCYRHFLPRKQVFFRRGAGQDHLDGLFIVRRGMVQIYRQISPLQEESIAVASAGELFGELSLVLTQPHSASIRAVNDSELIEITRETYNHLRATNEKVTIKLMEVMLKVLAKRLGRTTGMLFSPVKL